VGSNLRHELPILAHRVRKAALRGAKISFINPAKFEYLFPSHSTWSVHRQRSDRRSGGGSARPWAIRRRRGWLTGVERAGAGCASRHGHSA
jgi:hypothetical protein